MNEFIERFKEWFLDEPHPRRRSRRSAHNTPRRAARHRRSSRRGSTRSARRGTQTSAGIPMPLQAVGIAILVAVVLSIVLSGNSYSAIAVNPKNLCPIDTEHISGKTFVHIDLTERLNEEQRDALKATLETVAGNLRTREQLFISQMQTDSEAPRKEVQKFCSPDISRINVAGKRVTRADCPSIVSGEFRWARAVGKAVRDQITDACTNYAKLKKQVDKAAQRYSKVNVGQNRSYIIGGIEDVMHAADDEPVGAPSRLIIFSDMLQNSKWFSQYRTDSSQWTVENLKSLRAKATSMGKEPRNNLSEVLVCYLPSEHRVLNSADKRNKHKSMWKEYFKYASKTKFRGVESDGCANAAIAMMGAG